EEHWTYAVFIEIKTRGNSAGTRERDHSALIRANQSAFRGGKRNVERALCVCAMDQQRTGNPQRHLHGPNRILNVAAHLLTGRGERTHVNQRGPGPFFHPLAPGGNRNVTVALLLETRNQCSL